MAVPDNRRVSRLYFFTVGSAVDRDPRRYLPNESDPIRCAVAAVRTRLRKPLFVRSRTAAQRLPTPCTCDASCLSSRTVSPLFGARGVMITVLMVLAACATHTAKPSPAPEAVVSDSADAVARGLQAVRPIIGSLPVRVGYFRIDSAGYVIEFVPSARDVLGGTARVRVFPDGRTQLLFVGQ